MSLAIKDHLYLATIARIGAFASSLSPTGVEIFDFTTRYSYKQNNVKDIAFILSNKFEVAKETINGVGVYYYYYNDIAPQKSLKTITRAIDYFSKTFQMSLRFLFD